MKFKLILIILTGVLFLSSTHIVAQVPAATFTPSHLAAAENYLISTGINTQFGSITDNMVNTLSNQMPENNRAAFVNVMKTFMHKYYTWDVLKGDLSKIYAAEFTENELIQLTAFFNTPIGRKYGDKMSILTQKGMLMGQQVINDHRSELEQMMKDAMPDKN